VEIKEKTCFPTYDSMLYCYCIVRARIMVVLPAHVVHDAKLRLKVRKILVYSCFLSPLL
jgi:hypothetical protein